jgi:hypothetical protein
MSVYFITCRTVNMVKIGYAEGPHHVRQRLIGMRVGCPLDIALEMYLPGTEQDEKAMHELLKAHRVRGEWFWITQEIENLIQNPPEPPSDISILERPFDELDQHERLERIETEKWITRPGAERMLALSRQRRRERLLRELAELDAADGVEMVA